MKAIKLLLLLFLVQITLTTSAEEKYKNHFNWSEIEPLPQTKNMEQQFGLASPFAGVSNGAVIVTGGCNFPDKAVVDGGTKKYYSDIYVLPKNSDKWITGFDMPYSAAYGASVTTPKGVLCIGGNNNETEFDKVTLVKWNSKSSKIEIEEFPSLPVKLTSGGAAIIGNIIYVAGGQANGKLANTVLSLDLSKKNRDDFNWETLPNFPGAARLQPVVVSQTSAENTNLYIFGGSSFSQDKSTPDIATSGLCYNPTTKTWKETSEVSPKGVKPYSLHGASGLAIGKNHIVFIGGVNYDRFSDALLMNKKGSLAKTEEETTVFQNWRNDYFTKDAKWYNFNPEILVYNTITDSWSIGDNYPYPAPAGADRKSVV